MNKAVSLFLDAIRPAAALMVLVSHVCMGTILCVPALARTGVQAVDVFFVLSGFVIAHVCRNPAINALDYGLGRAVRILSVALPAIGITIVLDAIGITIDPALYQDGYQAPGPGVLLRSVTFLGEQWSTHRFPGSNSPYWSLSFEVWYYIIFGLFTFLPKRWRWLGAAVALFIIGPKVAVMLPVWLLGVATYEVCRRWRIPAPVAWVGLTASVLLLIGYQFLPYTKTQAFMPFELTADRLRSTAQDYFIATLFALLVCSFSSVSAVFQPLLLRLARPIRWLAGATFTIYLMHMPVLTLITAVTPWPRQSLQTLTVATVGTLFACLLLAEAFERRKAFWRRSVDRLVMRLLPSRRAVLG